jgi:hypothetical protein
LPRVAARPQQVIHPALGDLMPLFLQRFTEDGRSSCWSTVTGTRDRLGSPAPPTVPDPALTCDPVLLGVSCLPHLPNPAGLRSPPHPQFSHARRMVLSVIPVADTPRLFPHVHNLGLPSLPRSAAPARSNAPRVRHHFSRITTSRPFMPPDYPAVHSPEVIFAYCLSSAKFEVFLLAMSYQRQGVLLNEASS